jgi:hypothetical protein
VIVLNAKQLFSVDVQSAEGIVSDLQNETVTFHNCDNITVDAQVKTRSNLHKNAWSTQERRINSYLGE